MLGLLLVLVLAADAQTDAARLNRAASLAGAHRWAEAAAALKGVEPPQDPAQRLAFHRLKAAVDSGLGRPREAAQQMREALRLAPAKPDLLAATAVAERTAGELDSAVEHLRKAGPDPRWLTMIADIEETRGNYIAAVKAYQAAVDLAPEDEQYRFNLALEFLRHATFDAAIRTLAGAESPRSKALLGLAYFAEDKPAEASRALLDASRAAPDWDAPVRMLGELFLDWTAAPPARETVDRVCTWADQHESPHAQALCGGLFLRLAREDGSPAPAANALDRLARASKTAPNDAVAQCELAKAHEWAGQWTDARIPAEACGRLRPDSPEAQARLARIYQQLGLSDLARTAFERNKAAIEKQERTDTDRRAAIQQFIISFGK